MDWGGKRVRHECGRAMNAHPTGDTGWTAKVIRFTLRSIIGPQRRTSISILSRLFGSGPKREAQELPAEAYQGFRIIPAPQEAEGGYRIGARIEKEIGGEAKEHHLMRADVLHDRDAAEQAAIRKAKQVIDEQGDALFR